MRLNIPMSKTLNKSTQQSFDSFHFCLKGRYDSGYQLFYETLPGDGIARVSRIT